MASIRSTRGALRRSHFSVESVVRPGVIPQRYLSTTAPRAKAVEIITFDKTSTPELDAILNNIRENILLPYYLPYASRRKLTKERYKRELDHDPPKLEIDGKVYKFRYTPPKEIKRPKTAVAIRNAVQLMQTQDDFNNLPHLIQGITKLARYEISTGDMARIIRRAGMKNCLGPILNSVLNVKKTGLALNSSETINELLVWLQKRAIDTNWEAKATLKALWQTGNVMEWLESLEEHHHPKPSPLRTYQHFWRDPQVLAARLHMAAARAVKHLKGKDTKGLVERYAREVMTLWPKNKGLLDLHPFEAYYTPGEMRYLAKPEQFVWYAAPVLNGLKLAAQVVRDRDKTLAERLLDRAACVERELEKVLEKSGERGRDLHAKLFDANYEWPEKQARPKLVDQKPRKGRKAEKAKALKGKSIK